MRCRELLSWVLRMFLCAVGCCRAGSSGCYCVLQGAAELDPQDVNMNTKKALALGNALLVCMAVPWGVCVIVYSGAACLQLSGCRSLRIPSPLPV